MTKSEALATIFAGLFAISVLVISILMQVYRSDVGRQIEQICERNNARPYFEEVKLANGNLGFKITCK